MENGAEKCKKFTINDKIIKVNSISTNKVLTKEQFLSILNELHTKEVILRMESSVDMSLSFLCPYYSG